MKWYLIQRKSGRSISEDMLYGAVCDRQIVLPQMHELELRDVSGIHSVLRIPLEPSVKMDWDSEVSREEFDRILEEICQLAPQHSEAIRKLRPGSEIGHLLIERTGPACPEILLQFASYIIRDSIKTRLAWLPGIQLFPAHLKKIVPLRWELGQAVPERFDDYEIDCFIEEKKHSVQTANQMGTFHEMILPKANWFPPDCVPDGVETLRVAFVGTLPGKRSGWSLNYGRVELAFSNSDNYPCLRLLPKEDDMMGAYDLVREDAFELLREPGKWTLDFREVEQL
jgi:hypothetical protein